MFFLTLGIIFLVPSFIYLMKHKDERVTVRRYSWETEHQEPSAKAIVGWILVGLCAIWLFFLVLVLNAGIYVSQVQDIEQITKFEANKVVYETRATDLTERLSILLETKYPNHEQKIFDNLTPDNAELVFVAYPQLRAIEGFSKLADQIKGLRDRIYAQDVKIEEKRRAIRVRDRNIFYLTFLLPNE